MDVGDVVVIGTSITRDIGSALKEEGVSATTYTYGGGNIPFIRDRLTHIKKSHSSPKTILLQAGGNDCEKQPIDRVKQDYDGLVNDVKYLWPSARVIIGKVPPRRASVQTQIKIAQLNERLQSMNDPGLDISCSDFSPKITRYYNYDKIHFNHTGVKYYSEKVAQYLSNFHVNQTRLNP